MRTVQIDEMAKILGDNVKRLRNERGWSQSQLAERLAEGRARKVYVPFISSIESGDRNPSMQTLARLSEVFGVTPAELLREHEPTMA